MSNNSNTLTTNNNLNIANFIKSNNVPINPISKATSTNRAKRVSVPILPLGSVDNHNCIKPNIKTTPNQPCSDEISLQNISCEAISPPSAIQNYDKEHITFYLCDINSASYAAKKSSF